MCGYPVVFLPDLAFFPAGYPRNRPPTALRPDIRQSGLPSAFHRPSIGLNRHFAMFCVDIRQDCAIIRFRKMKRIIFFALIIRQLRRRQKQKYVKSLEIVSFS
jgi:hypothetical protein